MIDLNQFAKWQAEKPSREVEIKISKAETKAWVWDRALLVGQIVRSVDEIDLEAKRQRMDKERRDKERQEYEALKKRFEGVQA